MNVSPTCNRAGCGNPTAVVPVFVFVARGYPENPSTRVLSKLGIAICAACKEWATADLGATVAPDLRAKLNRGFQREGLAPVEFARIEWEPFGGQA